MLDPLLVASDCKLCGCSVRQLQGALLCSKHRCRWEPRKDEGEPGSAFTPRTFQLGYISESNPIAVSSNPAAAAVMREIDAALAAHLETVDMVPNQMIAANNPCKHSGTAATTCVGGNDLNQAVCKDPNSKCTSIQTQRTLGTADCRAANPKCIAFFLNVCRPNKNM